MKLLVTGAKGQVGSALCRLGARSPFEVIGLDSSALDITDLSAINIAMDRFQPDLLINAAAYTAVDRAESEPDKAESVNAIAAGNLAKVAAFRKIPMIHISTDYVFDGSKAEPYIETDPVAPLGVYGRTKLQGEKLVQKHHNSSIILRTSWVFGVEGNNFPKTMLRLAKERPELGVVADQRGCPTFADDIAAAILAIASQYERTGNLPWGIYHYVGKGACSWYEFATTIFEYAQAAGVISIVPKLKALATNEYPTAAKRPANSVLDCQKFCLEFPGIILADWREGVRQLLTFIGSI